MALKCPRDGSELAVGREHGIEIDRCPQCGGAWYEDEELEMLEGTVAGEEHRAGTIEYAKRSSELSCPECASPMRAFNYRAYNLELDACEDAHGFWLDAGEAQRVRDVMRERVRGLKRGVAAQRAWNRARGRGGGGIVDQLKGLFRR